jgi:hypothetical protein
VERDDRRLTAARCTRAILDTTASPVADGGPRPVTMSQIASRLARLAEVRDQRGEAGRRLDAVLGAYALISHQRRGHAASELAAPQHRDEHVADAHQQLHTMIRDLLAEASSLPSGAAVRRLVTLTLSGLRPPPEPANTSGPAARPRRQDD